MLLKFTERHALSVTPRVFFSCLDGLGFICHCFEIFVSEAHTATPIQWMWMLCIERNSSQKCNVIHNSVTPVTLPPLLIDNARHIWLLWMCEVDWLGFWSGTVNTRFVCKVLSYAVLAPALVYTLHTGLQLNSYDSQQNKCAYFMIL